jgi:transcription-repair coupling factor (superfamily II helicase)
MNMSAFPVLKELIPNKPNDKKYWCNLHDASKAYAIAETAKATQKIVLVVCDNSQLANELEEQVGFFAPDLPLLHFPDWETLPYDRFSPHQDIVSDRLRCLYQLTSLQQGVLFVPITTLMQRISPTTFVRQNSLQLTVGDTIRITELRSQLQSANYHCVDTVYEHGEFAVRGSIIDLFPMGSEYPYRLELFDEELEQIKTFNPENQLTISTIGNVDILPAKEFPFDKNSIELFTENWYKTFPHISLKETHFNKDLDQLISFSGIEYYLPLFFEHTANLLDHLPVDALVITTENIEANCRQHWHEIQLRYEQYRVDKTHPLLPPDTLFTPENELFEQLKKHPRIVLTAQQQDDVSKGFLDFHTQTASNVSIDAHATRPYQRLEAHLAERQTPILFCAESLGRKEALLEIFKSINTPIAEVDSWQRFYDAKTPLAITVSPITRGMKLDTVEVIAEAQLFGNRVQQRRRRKASQDNNSDLIIKSLTELKLGAPVVHIDHGIGRYLGLKVIEVDGEANEFLTLKYADDAILYVPVASLHLISRYAGADDEHAPLHKLGNDQWQKAKRKATEKIHDVAAELLEIYARRAARKGFSHDAYSNAYQQFAASFPFEETADQTQAIAKVLEDMAAPKPMDRLVCGDVGFGKTEVAMRAAFTAAYNGKQVAVLVPTTLLAQQHYESFCDRFAEYPFNIEVLSRFKTTKEQNEVIKKLAEGKVDILIGTHKLLQSDVKFTELGLVILDEEHRFGVKQKETLKALRADVDVLALTATPIPRTLNMSMAGMRDLSIIATPPAKRLSIKTFVRVRDNNLLKEAILRELLRGGQVYYLHNEVETIENTARELEELIPEARIGVGHGQMRERQLESVMSDFYHKRFNILVCTTIIETGIDVPSANTIIIDRADKFGLAQLHQLRGRVGRSHHQAYAYLLIPDAKKLSKDAEKRLEAIEQTTDLGAGFTLATHDLEIRGAGELLGDEQSGQIQTLGFTLYMEMLEKAVKSIQRGEKINLDDPLQKGTEVNLNISAIIPADYLPDVHTRLIMYKSIANCKDDRELRNLKVEMIDRFGLLPQPINNLFEVTAFKLRAEKLGIEKIEMGSTWGKILFRSNTTVNPMNIVKLVQSQPAIFRLEGSSTLKFKQSSETIELRFQLINDLLNCLEAK